jgi:hypothetical protein
VCEGGIAMCKPNGSISHASHALPRDSSGGQLLRGPIDDICFRLRSSDFEHAVQILRAVCPK